MTRRSGPFLLAVIPILLGGCTIIRVGEGSTAHVLYYPGVAIVKLDPRGRNEIVSRRSLGLDISGSSLSLGWVSTDMALLPPHACELILWKPAEGTARALHDLLPDTKICNVNEGKRP
jgi:hypothetical protein